MSQQINNSYIQALMARIAFLSLFLILCSFNAAQAQNNTGIRLNLHIDIDPTGNAKVTHDLSMPAREYAALRQTVGDAFHVIRSMETNQSWLDLKNIQARFEDQKQSIIANCDATGLLRTTGPGLWQFSLGGQQDGLELLDIHDRQAILCDVTEMPMGVLRSYFRISVPEGSTNLEFDAERGVLSYEYHPVFESGDRIDAEYDLQVQDRIMSSLAKIYSTENSSLFAARHLFTNTGNQNLNNYRVRFRIDGYSGWSAWKKCRVVYPGQTVLDYFYPVFDIDKLAELTGTRHAMIESEMEYTTESGEKIVESDARRVQILSRNEVVYSTRKDHENLNWFEQFNLAPAILTCFTNGTDPVIQQFAGRISSLAGGPASSLDSEHAVAYLDTMWRALQANKLAYQTSPTLSVDKHFGQHVKYARDVLRNRAGTCIDLAILWASAAESVGLRAHIAIIPGHAFPIIQLPNGNMLPIESTMLGKHTFEEAVKRGFEELKESQESGMIMIVDIEEMRSEQGFRSLDLPNMSEDVLAKWGYSFDSLPNTNETATTNDNAQENQQSQEEYQQQPDPRTTTARNSYLGNWAMETQLNGYTFAGVQRFQDDGSYACVMVIKDPQGNETTIKEQGTYIDRGTHFDFNTNQGEYAQKYRWNGNNLEMEFPDLGVFIQFVKVSE